MSNIKYNRYGTITICGKKYGFFLSEDERYICLTVNDITVFIGTKQDFDDFETARNNEYGL